MLIHRILVPTDFSDQARHALQYAAELARLYAAPMTLLHVFTPPVAYVPEAIMYISPPDPRAIEASLAQGLEQMKRQAQELGAEEVTTKIGHGSPWHEIVEIANRDHYDLIVMGTHGRGPLKHVVLGSVAEKVVRKAHCPVLTVGPAS